MAASLLRLAEWRRILWPLRRRCVAAVAPSVASARAFRRQLGPFFIASLICFLSFSLCRTFAPVLHPCAALIVPQAAYLLGGCSWIGLHSVLDHVLACTTSLLLPAASYLTLHAAARITPRSSYSVGRFVLSKVLWKLPRHAATLGLRCPRRVCTV